MTLTDEQLEILRHTVGNQGISDKMPGFRNYYYARDGHEGCESLVQLGLMERGRVGTVECPGDHRYYIATDEGMQIGCAPFPGMREYVVEMTDDAAFKLDTTPERTRMRFRTRTRAAAKYMAAKSLHEVWDVPMREALVSFRVRLSR